MMMMIMSMLLLVLMLESRHRGSNAPSLKVPGVDDEADRTSVGLWSRLYEQ